MKALRDYRILLGLLLLVSGFLTQMYFYHRFHYWTIRVVITEICILVGLILIVVPIWQLTFGKEKERSGTGCVVYAITLFVVMFSGDFLESWTKKQNVKYCERQLQEDTEEIQAKFIDIKEKKFQSTRAEFFIIEFEQEGRLIKTGVLSDFLKEKDFDLYVDLIYNKSSKKKLKMIRSKKDPTIFQILDYN